MNLSLRKARKSPFSTVRHAETATRVIPVTKEQEKDEVRREASHSPEAGRGKARTANTSCSPCQLAAGPGTHVRPPRIPHFTAIKAGGRAPPVNDIKWPQRGDLGVNPP